MSNADFLGKYKLDTMYVNPAGDITYITYVTLDNYQVSPQIKLAIQAIYINEKKDTNTFQLIKLKLKGLEWEETKEKISVSKFQLSKIHDFMKILSGLDLSDAQKDRFSLVKGIDPASLETILGTPEGTELLKNIANKSVLTEDVFALARKKEALKKFETMIQDSSNKESDWQSFFEDNSWIFGHGLNYIFVDSAKEKLEQIVKGNDFNTPGKRVDALMKTRAEISQYVLVEIKKASTPLLGKEYRSGCWQLSDEASGAITQIQKTCYEFVQNRFRDELRDGEGNRTGEIVYAVQPRSYLIIGNLKELAQNDDKFVSFELLRKSISSPEIITFDELYERAKCIICNIGGGE